MIKFGSKLSIVIQGSVVLLFRLMLLAGYQAVASIETHPQTIEICPTRPAVN